MITPALTLRLARATSSRGAARAADNGNPRVQVFPSADGVVLLVGVTIEGRWVAEYRCLAADFDERCVEAMERRVLAKERSVIRVLR